MFDKFVELVADQFNYGGQKYALNGNNVRESTDELFDKHGFRWLIGTIDKYTFRFKNCAREKDLLKIATYQYIMWLKRGFFVMKAGINDPAIDTNLKNKQDNFGEFIGRIKKDEPFYSNWNLTWSALQAKNPEIYNVDVKLTNTLVHSDEDLINIISKTLTGFSKGEWKDIKENDLLYIFWLCYFLWERNFKEKAGQDTDTWNKGDKNIETKKEEINCECKVTEPTKKRGRPKKVQIEEVK